MAADEIQQLRAELAEMRNVMKGMHRMGRVHKVEDGRIRVDFGQGDGGDEGGKDTGVWIRTSHGGAVSEGVQWAEGETVHVFAMGGNPEHAFVQRGGYNDQHPIDPNDKKDNTSRRWRKPPEQKQGQEQQGEGGGGSTTSYGETKPREDKWKDDEKDHQEVNTHEKRHFQFKDYKFTATDDGLKMEHKDYKFEHGKDGFKVNDDKGFMKLNKGTVTVGDDKAEVEINGGKIKVKGEITDSMGRKFAVAGTMTSDGKVLASKFANEA